MRKAFLERAVVYVVYKFNEKSTARVFEKVSQLLKCRSNFFLVIYINPHLRRPDKRGSTVYTDNPITLPCSLARAGKYQGTA